jgi:hypothetical protein
MSPIAAGTLIRTARDGNAPVIAGAVICLVGLLATIGCSALDHLSRDTPRKRLYRRRDDAAIFLSIAATYTQFALRHGAQGAAALALVRAVAACGIILMLLKPHIVESGFGAALPAARVERAGDLRAASLVLIAQAVPHMKQDADRVLSPARRAQPCSERPTTASDIKTQQLRRLRLSKGATDRDKAESV